MNSEPQLNVTKFRSSLSGEKPPSDVSAQLEALWWVAKGVWNAAHSLVQGDKNRNAAWVHAHLHRVEGDLANARYWYRLAGKKDSAATFDDE